MDTSDSNNNNSHNENDLHAPSTPSSSSSLALVADAEGSGAAGGVVTLGDWLVGKQVRGDRSATNVYHSLFFELSRTHSLTITPNITFYHCPSLFPITNTYHHHSCLSLIYQVRVWWESNQRFFVADVLSFKSSAGTHILKYHIDGQVRGYSAAVGSRYRLVVLYLS